MYPDYEYKHIKNVKAFSEESLLSSVGGYIGIFLGVSFLQIPAVIKGLVAWLKNVYSRQQIGQGNDNNANVDEDARDGTFINRGSQVKCWVLSTWIYLCLCKK